MEHEQHWIATPHLRPDFGGPQGRAFSPFVDPAHALPMVDRLRAIVDTQRGRTAVECDGEVTTYAGLWHLVGRLARAIEQSGAEPGHVGVLLPPGPACLAAVFACLAARRPCVPLDASVPDARNARLAAQTGLTQVVCMPGMSGPSDWPNIDVIRVPLDGAEPADQEQAPGRSLPLDAPAFILCTSGSTGQPKPIVHSQRTILHWVRTTNGALQTRADDRALTLSSPASLGGMLGMLHFILAGASLQTLDVKTSGLAALLGTLAARPVTILRAAPSMLRSLAKLPDVRTAFAGLRAVQTYGEPLLKADLAEWRPLLPLDCLVLSTYGATEASGMGGFVGAGDDHDPIRAAAGVLMPDTVAAIVGEDGRSCARGEAGELWIRSRYNALGEWHDGRLVAGRLTPHDSGDGTRVYKTGDLARCHADGVFVVLGRRDRMTNVNGQRVEPAEIEVLLRAHAAVHEAEVIVVKSEAQADRLVAFVVAADAAPADWLASLRTSLRASLPVYMVPSRIVPIGSIPRLPGGKVDGPALARLAAAPPAGSS